MSRWENCSFTHLKNFWFYDMANTNDIYTPAHRNPRDLRVDTKIHCKPLHLVVLFRFGEFHRRYTINEKWIWKKIIIKWTCFSKFNFTFSCGVEVAILVRWYYQTGRTLRRDLYTCSMNLAGKGRGFFR